MTDLRLQSSQPATLRIRLPCHLAEVRPAALRVSDFLHEHGARPEEVQACELALVEACNNAVQYATDDARSNTVSIDALVDASNVELRIRDHTPGFEWPNDISLPDPEQERGRGLFLIQSLMDEATYLRSPNGNCLFLRKQLAFEASPKTNAAAPAPDQLGHQLRESEQVISDMAEELSFCYESLSAIFRCSAELGRSHDLNEFSQRLLNDLAQITSADWFVLRLLSKDGSKLSVFTASQPDLDLPPIAVNDASDVVPRELLAARSRQDTWLDRETHLGPLDPLLACHPECTGLIHPFSLGDQLIGTVAIGKTAGSTPFTAVHANVVHTFADFLGIQIANARFQEEQVHARLVSRELEIAKNIQRSLLPTSLPNVPGYGLAGYCESAQQVGGDFYDVLKFDEHSLLLIVADVMGKGLPAAMFAAILRSLVRAAPEWTDRPGQLLSRINRLLFKELSGVDMFITAQLVFVDTSKRRMVAASAGHCPMLLADGQGQPVRVISPEGMPLGIVPDTAFRAEEEELSCSSRILLYTDGLTEARNAEGEFFGQERLVNWFQHNSRQPRSAEAMKAELAAELLRFQGVNALQDDQTFLIMA